MTLRKKTLMTVGITFVCLIVALYFISESVLLGSFVELEEQNTRENVKRVLNASSDDIVALKATAADWASWDDTYTFIEDVNSDYIESNLIDGTFTELRLNLMLFIHDSGRIVYGKAFDLHNEEEILISQRLQEYFSADNILTHHPNTESSIAGIVLLSESPMLIASQPILTSEDKGPVRGALIMGRYLDIGEINRLAEQMYLSLTIHRCNYSPMPADFQAAMLSLADEVPILVRPLDEQSIAGYALLEDIYGKPILLLRVDRPRDIYVQGQDSVSYFILSLLVVGLVLGVVIMLFLDRQVLSRLSQLSKSVGAIGIGDDLSARLSMKGKDELSSLAGAINNMVEGVRRTLSDNSPVGVYIVQDGTFKHVNPRFRNLVDYTEDELLERWSLGLVHPEDREGVRKNAVEMLKGKRLSPYEFRIVDKGGETRWAIETVTSIQYSGGPATLGNFMDITERKRMERMLQERNEQLQLQAEELIKKTKEVERANQLKSEFLANVSHDLRTPLNAIIGFSQLLVDEVPGKINEEQSQCLSDILDSSQHLLNLINDVLDLSRIESGKVALKLESVTLAEVLGSLARTMMPILTPRQQRFDFKIEEGLPSVHIDKAKLEQVLFNLLSNSAKFTQDGGRLRIEAVKEGDWCQVSVIDNGIGIKKEDQERIFEPFCRIDNSLTDERSGTGLGLALVKQIVERHGGRIWVESEYRKGSQFIFTAPLATVSKPNPEGRKGP